VILRRVRGLWILDCIEDGNIRLMFQDYGAAGRPPTTGATGMSCFLSFLFISRGHCRGKKAGSLVDFFAGQHERLLLPVPRTEIEGTPGGGDSGKFHVYTDAPPVISQAARRRGNKQEKSLGRYEAEIVTEVPAAPKCDSTDHRRALLFCKISAKNSLCGLCIAAR